MPKSAPVIVIEDNPTDVFLVREALRAQGIADVLVFEDGEAAIGYVRKLDTDQSPGCPSLILLDLNLPCADGFEVLRNLRTSTACGNTPVIIMTSSAALPDRTKATALGASAYFQKPTTYDAFLKLGEIAQHVLNEQP